MAPRFVILQHDHPFLHWDFLLECGTTAATWRLLQTPATGIPLAAERLADHRLHYLSYEGPVTGNRGSVRRVWSGCWDGDLAETGCTIQLMECEFASSAELTHSATGNEMWIFRK
jgi:hypothetical protein